MRRGAALVAALALTAGCFYPRSQDPSAHRTAYWVDVGAMIAAVGIAVIPTGDGDQFAEMKGHFAEGLLALAVVGLVVNAAMSGGPDRDQALVDAADRAVEAAYGGDCATAKTLMLPIFQRDRGYFDEVVRSEPGVARCLR